MSFPIPDSELLRLVQEDVPYDDVTTEGLGIAARPGRAGFTAAADMVAACVEDAARLLDLCGCRSVCHVRSGTAVARGTLLLEATGDAGALHRAGKTAQVLIELASGIASRAAAIVAAARAVAPQVAVACTRKHMPGAKRIALKAIMAGGAVPHRLGLSDSVLVFADHRVFLAEGTDLAAVFRRLRAHAPERCLRAEAETEAEALALARAGVDVVQIDKATPESVARLAAAFQACSPRPLLAAAGGINETNAAAFAAAGADLLVTSAPYYATPRDVKLRMSPLPAGQGA
ncbi:putative pyrophosphorylase ModD [Rhodovastum atsumiense]|uniref:Putative pyrophosphorylase ModD n=1 Tax=Rhodovastum atsumiense TaxID=504468 RepID=A0A5M6IQR7_9PROT|nr:ModD protein [Rhodovastum atsumiense]KAA5610624.1 ModD protein [Rhodovastum atsumiense]CAH2600745.1 putative pyrophosphorylase ModD [Rhodovastum atsumiense]